MKPILILLFLSLPIVSQAKTDTSYFDSRGRKIYYHKNAEFFVVTEKGGQQEYTTKEYQYSSGIIKMSGVFSSAGNGVVTFYDAEGRKETEGRVESGKREGEWKTYRADDPDKVWISSHYVHDSLDGVQESYYPSGSVKRDELYENGRLISGKRYDEQGSEVAYTPFEVEAKPQVDMKSYITDFVQYPGSWRVRGIAGQVLVEFIVDKTGKIDKLRIVEQGHPLMDAESIRLISAMKPWKPAMKDDEPVPAKFTVPVNFSR